MRFDPEYVAHVLTDNFEDAKAHFFAPLMAVQYAHLVMLAEQGIVSRADASTIRAALDGISEDAVRTASYDGAVEDLFSFLERLIIQTCGENVAGRLHTARSRNDIDMTVYRMWQRELILELLTASLELRRALLDLASRHRDTIFAVHTHTQRAQPTTIAHYLLGVVEQLERDGARLKAAYVTTNQNPLGACAITGTGFDIDRNLTSELLGFSGPTRNTYGSVAAVDYLLESVSAVSVLLVGLGRVVQDLLIWCTAEFDYLRLGDGFVQCSSIMPQKRNPVAFEHARAIASKAIGQAQAVLVSVHNTPFGDVVDTEDDLQPLVFSTFRDATRAVKVIAAAIKTAEFDAARLEARAADGWTTLTELADTLARDHDVPFKTAHAICARLIAAREADAATPLAQLLAAVSAQVLPSAIVYSDGALKEILSPRHFVLVRRTYGGPAPEETLRASKASRATLDADRAWVAASTEQLTHAQERLANRAATL